jgi:hypothetical protein
MAWIKVEVYTRSRMSEKFSELKACTKWEEASFRCDAMCQGRGAYSYNLEKHSQLFFQALIIMVAGGLLSKADTTLTHTANFLQMTVPYGARPLLLDMMMMMKFVCFFREETSQLKIKMGSLDSTHWSAKLLFISLSLS